MPPVAVRLAVTGLAVALACVAGWQLWVYYMQAPWTRDGRVRAEVVQVTADVSGLVSDVLVHDNQAVVKGQVLFRIDPVRFSLALRQAEADLLRAQAGLEEAQREASRYHELTNLEVSQEHQQQRTAAATEAGASYALALAARDLAKLNLDRSEVHASVNGLVTNFGLRPGDFVDAGHPVFALVDTDSFYVSGYFEETKLARIAVGDKARAFPVGGPGVIEGHVDSIAGGIADRERQDSADLLANVNPTFSWVRLAQRVPVRIAIDRVPAGLRLVTGRTTTVEVLPPSAAR
jgi:RND family efflux transporter MFP subunit